MRGRLRGGQHWSLFYSCNHLDENKLANEMGNTSFMQMIVSPTTFYFQNFDFFFLHTLAVVNDGRYRVWHTFFLLVAAGVVLYILIQLVGSVGSSAVKQ